MAMLIIGPSTNLSSLDIHVSDVVRRIFALYDCFDIGGVSDLDYWTPHKSWTKSERLWIRRTR